MNFLPLQNSKSEKKMPFFDFTKYAVILELVIHKQIFNYGSINFFVEQIIQIKINVGFATANQENTNGH